MTAQRGISEGLVHETLHKLRLLFSNWIHLHMSIYQLLHMYAKQYFCNIRVIPVKSLRLEIVACAYLSNIAVQPSSF